MVFSCEYKREPKKKKKKTVWFKSRNIMEVDNVPRKIANLFGEPRQSLGPIQVTKIHLLGGV